MRILISLSAFFPKQMPSAGKKPPKASVSYYLEAALAAYEKEMSAAAPNDRERLEKKWQRDLRRLSGKNFWSTLKNK